MSKLTLPCGHTVDETAARYVSTEVKNFYTCRQCSPEKLYMALPFHWVEKQLTERQVMPKSPEQIKLEEQLAEVRKQQRIRWQKSQKQEKGLRGRLFGSKPEPVTA